MTRDLRIALRSLAHRPGFALAVIATLALGLGANAALFSVVDAVMLRSLPFSDAERLVSISETVRRDDRVERRTLSYPDFVAIRDEADAFAAVAARSAGSFVVTGGERAVRLRGESVSPEYFRVLGATPSLGRGFSADPDESAAEVVIGHELWTTRFGADRDILGATLRLGGEPHEVIGVMPAGFAGVTDDQELWTRLEERPDDYGNRYLGAVARLAAGATLDRANQELATIFARLEEEYPENKGYGAIATSLREDRLGDLVRPVTLLFAAVGLLLLIACVNVANLLLVHRGRQRRQAAIRLALGAGTADLVRWSVVEVMVLGVLGGGLGLLLATWGLALLVRSSPLELPSYAAIGVSSRVALFAFALAGVVAMVLGAATAFQVRRDGSSELLRRGAATIDGGGGARRWLLAAEVALALVVSIGAISTVQGWRSLVSIDPGFQADAATFRVLVPEMGGPDAWTPGKGDSVVEAFYRRVRDAAAAIPGVETVALASDVPLEGGYSAFVISPEGSVPRPDEPYRGGYRAYRHVVSADYFAALGIPLVRGEGFADVRSDSTPAAVISGRLAAKLFPGEEPIGRRFKIGSPPSSEDLAAIAADPENDPWITVVGLVGEVRHRTLRPDPARIAEDPDLYLPLEQWPRRSLSGVVRGAADPESILPELRRRLEGVHAEMPVFGLATLGDNLDIQTARSRFATILMSLFALLSLGLAALGIYGVMAYQVSEKTREIGIRMALGASRRRVLRRTLGEGLHATGIGLAIGLVATVGIATVASRKLGDDGFEGLVAGDPRAVLVAVTILAVVAVAACLLPANRASRVDPLVALREE